MKDTDQSGGQRKTCTKCGMEKGHSEFQKDSHHPSGLRSHCKECIRAYKKSYRSEYAETIKAYAKARYHSDPKRFAKENKAWREANPEKESSRKKKWREANPEFHAEWQRNNPTKVKQYQKKYCEQNREIRILRGRMWRERHPDKQREINRISNQKRRSTAKGKLEQFVRNGIWKAISRGEKNGRKTMELLGYSIEQLKAHLEKQFWPGMTWENYGEWHIDHIIPLSAHNYKTPDDVDFKKAWALKNLQPLWAIDNIRKKDSLLHDFQPSLTI